MGFSVALIEICKLLLDPLNLTKGTDNLHALQLLTGLANQLIGQFADDQIERIDQARHDIDQEKKEDHHDGKPDGNLGTKQVGHND